jgi:hypothetical protein
LELTEVLTHVWVGIVETKGLPRYATVLLRLVSRKDVIHVENVDVSGNFNAVV